ncbi:MAG: site-specific DNA-methyltransferase [Candidatus Thorarchaeota archaeon]|nr:site-specific DNA-methyltransferase [Candidatus Thorarchaeota archaeon]
MQIEREQIKFPRDIGTVGLVESRHQLIIGDARDMASIQAESVNLVVTSPPYPMIQMWDEIFTSINPTIQHALSNGDGHAAFEIMHQELDRVWREAYRVLRPGGIMCINIGDATRKIGPDFQVYANHARVLRSARTLGLQVLPWIIWRKPTNSPSKFMGSGMMPPSAYVTLEHEYILIFRKGGLRKFKTEDEKQRRRESAYFWEERNHWFSDIWNDVAGASQTLDSGESRDRSAAFPVELPYRLIQMFSVFGDTVLDPFAGTGTTLLASILTARNSIGIEIDPALMTVIDNRIRTAPSLASTLIQQRIQDHIAYVNEREQSRDKTQMKYMNKILNCPVMTKQEIEMRLYRPVTISKTGDSEYAVQYETYSPSTSSIDPVR